MNKPRIFVPRAVVPEAMELLRTRCQVEVGPEGNLPHAELVKAVRGYDGIFTPVITLNAEVIDAMAPTCKVISCFGVGFDHVDIAAATRNGIWVTHNPGFVTEDTADIAFALLLGAARRLRECDLYVRSGTTPWPACIGQNAGPCRQRSHCAGRCYPCGRFWHGLAVHGPPPQ